MNFFAILIFLSATSSFQKICSQECSVGDPNTYEGDFKAALPDGSGTYTWSNGNSFKVKFEKGLKQGETGSHEVTVHINQ